MLQAHRFALLFLLTISAYTNCLGQGCHGPQCRLPQTGYCVNGKCTPAVPLPTMRAKIETVDVVNSSVQVPCCTYHLELSPLSETEELDLTANNPSSEFAEAAAGRTFTRVTRATCRSRSLVCADPVPSSVVIRTATLLC